MNIGGRGGAQTWRIVLIEDNADDRSELRRLLLKGSERRYELVEVATGRAGVERVRDGSPPTCVLLDYHLPDMDAVEVLTALLGPDGLAVCPVVVITVQEGSEVGPAILRAGAQDFVGKGWMTPESLTRAVENAVERWAMARELHEQGRALHEREQQLRLFVEHVPAAVAMFDRDMRYLAVSRRWRSCYDLGDASLEGRSHYEVFPDLPDRWREVHRRALAGEVVKHDDDRFDRADGTVQWLRWEARPWPSGEGEAGGILLFTEDITDRRAAEQNLRRSRDTFLQLIQGNPFGVYVVDADFRLAQVSAGAQKVFEQVRPLPGRDFAQVIRQIWSEPFASEMLARFRHTLTTGEPYQAASVERRADLESVESYDWRIEQIVLPDGRAGVVCYFYDLSERQRLEAAVRENESFLRQTLESIPGMVFTATPEGAMDWMSEPWVELTGTPAAQLLGDGWTEVIHPEDRPAALERWRAAVERGSDFDAEHRLRRRDGAFEWHKVRARPLRDAEGRVARWFGTAIDVDDLKTTEEALRARERELRSVADSTPDLLARFDREERCVLVNAAFTRAVGREPAEVIGRTLRELLEPGVVLGACLVDWRAALGTAFEGRPSTIDHPCATAEGLRHFSTRVVPEPGSDGRIEHVLVVAHDVTDRQRFEEALQDSDRRKDEFLATLAHELRNPLAPIRNGLEILRRGEAVTGPVVRAREMMERQLHHLVRLVDDLLDVSRISRGKVELQRARVELAAVVEHALEASRPLVESAGHTLVVRLAEEPIGLDGDITRLAQVLSNVLNNAAKYTPTGGRIVLSAGREGQQAVLRVVDDGVGISAEMLPRVFDMFTQADRTIDRAQGGLGIGLSLAKRLVEMHGGSIQAESAGLGRGSTFTIRLPIAAPPPAEGQPPAPHAPGTTRPSGHRVLVVDDNVDGAESLALMLELFGHEARTAHDGPMALATARSFHPEVVFLDIGLPGMDGYEVARRLRQDPGLGSALLVALTGWGSEDHKRRSAEAGFDFHLTKPAETSALREVLGRVSERAVRATSDPAL